MRRVFILLPSAFILLLTACAAPMPQAGHVVGPDEAQAILYDATVTARAAATQSANASATRVREQEFLADDSTRTAAQAQAVATALAATPTAFAQMATATAYAFDGRARETAYAISAAATQSAVVQREADATRSGWISAAFAFVAAFGVLAFAYYLYWRGRIHIATLALRELGGGLVAQFRPRENEWDIQAPRLSAPVVSLPAEPASARRTIPINSAGSRRVIEVEPVDPHTLLWRSALAVAVNAASECGWTCAAWLLNGVVRSAEDWKTITDECANAGIVEKQNGVATGWRAGMDRVEAIRALNRQLLSFPKDVPPPVRLSHGLSQSKPHPPALPVQNENSLS